MPAPRQLRRRFIVGVGMTKFEKPGLDWDYTDMARIAGKRALADATVDYKEIEQVFASYCYGDSTCGQRAVYELGLTGVPVVNVNNNCSSGSSALFLAAQTVGGGLADCVMAIGFEKMQKGSLTSQFNDRTNPLDKHVGVMVEQRGFEPKAPPAAQMFGGAGLEHHEKYGSTGEHLAKIAYKNHRNSQNNPYSQFQEEYSLEQIKKDKKVYADLTKSMCCPTSDGAACVIVASEEFVRKHGLEGQAIEIVGQSMKTDYESSFKESMIKMVGFDMARSAADEAYAQAKVKPTDVNVLELHDCFAANELITYEALRLCPDGEAHKFVDAGDNDYGGRIPTAVSGGLISKGHPLGATGCAMACEICWQLREEAGKRQVKNARIGMTHNLGLGGACVVTIFKRPEEWRGKPMKRAVSLGASIPKELAEEPSLVAQASAKL